MAHDHRDLAQYVEANTCRCGHRRRDHRIEGEPGCLLDDIRWMECEVCACTQFDGSENIRITAHNDGTGCGHG